MAEKPNIREIFPDEVAEIIEGGAGLPDIYFGPVYRGNGGKEALAKLEDRVKAAKAAAPEAESH